MDELRSLHYPPGYIVSSFWARNTDQFVKFCKATNDVRKIAFIGMSKSFDVGLPKANISWLTGSRARYVERYPELRTVGESPLVPSDRVIDCDGVTFSLDNGAFRSTANTVLRRVTMPPEELTRKLISAADASDSLSDERLGYLYFAALYTRDVALRERLFLQLRSRHIADGFHLGREYNFDAVGEVRFLRR